jgi:hypothetical protein
MVDVSLRIRLVCVSPRSRSSIRGRTVERFPSADSSGALAAVVGMAAGEGCRGSTASADAGSVGVGPKRPFRALDQVR